MAKTEEKNIMENEQKRYESQEKAFIEEQSNNLYQKEFDRFLYINNKIVTIIMSKKFWGWFTATCFTLLVLVNNDTSIKQTMLIIWFLTTMAWYGLSYLQESKTSLSNTIQTQIQGNLSPIVKAISDKIMPGKEEVETNVEP